MTTEDREKTLKLVTEAHAIVEKAYLSNPPVKEDPEYLNKRKLLLADLSLHIVQACVKEELDIAKIKRYLFSILTISNDFAPEAGLLSKAESLLDLEQM
jgi:hypothetical protein